MLSYRFQEGCYPQKAETPNNDEQSKGGGNGWKYAQPHATHHGPSHGVGLRALHETEKAGGSISRGELDKVRVWV